MFELTQRLHCGSAFFLSLSAAVAMWPSSISGLLSPACCPQRCCPNVSHDRIALELLVLCDDFAGDWMNHRCAEMVNVDGVVCKLLFFFQMSWQKYCVCFVPYFCRNRIECVLREDSWCPIGQGGSVFIGNDMLRILVAAL